MRYLQKNPSLSALFLMVAALMVVSAAEMCFAQDGGSVEALLFRAKSALVKGNLQDAVDLSAQAAGMDSKNETAILYRSVAYARIGDRLIQEAINLAPVLDRVPEDLLAGRETDFEKSITKEEIGGFALKEAQSAFADNDFNRVVSIADDTLGSEPQNAYAMIFKGMAYAMLCLADKAALVDLNQEYANDEYFVMAFREIWPEMYSANVQSRFTLCREQLNILKLSQDFFMEDNSRYSGDVLELTGYTLPGCDSGVEEGGRCDLMKRINGNCKDFSLEINADGTGYIMSGKALIGSECTICATPQGISPQTFEECKEAAGNDCGGF